MAPGYDAISARALAPPYGGEGPFAMWHFSEDADLEVFHPRPPKVGPVPVVWAVDTRHAPMFWFPRECPRGCIWVVPTTTEVDREAFFGQSSTQRVHVMESAWLDKARACRLHAYRLLSEPFQPHESVGGYWVAPSTVAALERVDVGDLLARHAEAGIELRITPSIRPFWDKVVTSTVEYSGHRLANSQDRRP